LVPILSQIRLAHIFLFPTKSILILSSHLLLGLIESSFRFRFSDQNFVCISHLPCVLHAPFISSFLIWASLNNIWCLCATTGKIMYSACVLSLYEKFWVVASEMSCDGTARHGTWTTEALASPSRYRWSVGQSGHTPRRSVGIRKCSIAECLHVKYAKWCLPPVLTHQRLELGIYHIIQEVCVMGVWKRQTDCFLMTLLGATNGMAVVEWFIPYLFIYRRRLNWEHWIAAIGMGRSSWMANRCGFGRRRSRCQGIIQANTCYNRRTHKCCQFLFRFHVEHISLYYRIFTLAFVLQSWDLRIFFDRD
jgi:hypothetical protein